MRIRTWIIVLIGTLVAGGVCAAAVYSRYDVRFVNVPKYNLVFINRQNSSVGYGVRYKQHFAVWRFGEDARGNAVTKKIFP